MRITPAANHSTCDTRLGLVLSPPSLCMLSRTLAALPQGHGGGAGRCRWPRRRRCGGAQARGNTRGRRPIVEIVYPRTLGRASGAPRQHTHEHRARRGATRGTDLFCAASRPSAAGLRAASRAAGVARPWAAAGWHELAAAAIGEAGRPVRAARQGGGGGGAGTPGARRVRRAVAVAVRRRVARGSARGAREHLNALNAHART